MLDIVLVLSHPYFLQNDSGDTSPRDVQPLLGGNYFVVSDGTVQVTDEVVLTRAISRQTGSRIEVFTNQVRERDKRCVVTKTENVNAEFNMWAGFEAAHIFPLRTNANGNGLLLANTLHNLFDSYMFSINPDDDYKVIYFQRDFINVAGTHLDARLLEYPRRPVDELLRWHFRQAVLTNMRGAGEPVLEHDFPPGSNIMGQIMAGPVAAERMEFELFDRLGRHVELYGKEEEEEEDDDDGPHDGDDSGSD